MKAYLEHVAPAENKARFYAVVVEPSLFGDWTVFREWGRIGQGGTIRTSAHATEAEAIGAARRLIGAKARRNYTVIETELLSPVT
ncbi:MAG: WGR domain-containing protein [Hyphomicrobium sp.]